MRAVDPTTTLELNGVRLVPSTAPLAASVTANAKRVGRISMAVVM